MDLRDTEKQNTEVRERKQAGVTQSSCLNGGPLFPTGRRGGWQGRGWIKRSI